MCSFEDDYFVLFSLVFFSDCEAKVGLGECGCLDLDSRRKSSSIFGERKDLQCFGRKSVCESVLLAKGVKILSASLGRSEHQLIISDIQDLVIRFIFGCFLFMSLLLSRSSHFLVLSGSSSFIIFSFSALLFSSRLA